MFEARIPGRRRVALGAIGLVVVAALLFASPQPAWAGTGLRRQMLALTNEGRRAHDRGALRLDRRLSNTVRRHSVRMARRGALFHSSHVPSYLHGRRWQRWGENVGMTFDSDLHSLQHAFMRSPSHRRNVLDRRFDRVGIGVARRDGRVWVTLVFYG
jgi:uncharacterized protein YkwD